MLVDPISKIPFYVGKGSKDRAFVHFLLMPKKDNNKLKKNKINKII